MAVLALTSACARSVAPADVADVVPDTLADVAPDYSFADAPYETPSLLRACVLATICGGSDHYGSVGACVRNLEWMTRASVFVGRESRGRVDCLVGAADCPALMACLDRSGLVSPLCQNEHFSGAYCIGTERILCRGGILISRVDCGARGGSCDGTYCVDPNLCTNVADFSDRWRCDGTRSIACPRLNSRFRVIDCALEEPGTVCVPPAESPDGQPCQVAATERCNGAGVSCDGNIASVCADNRIVRFDCELVHGACALGDRSGVPCRAVAECDTFTARDRCAGTSIQACIDGRFASLDCRSIGYRGCVDPIEQLPVNCAF